MDSKVRPNRGLARSVWRAFWLFVVGCLSLLCHISSSHAAGQRWKLNIVPASLHRDRTVHLVAGHLQPINVMIQAWLPARRDLYDVELEIDLPSGIRIMHTAGRYQLGRTASREQNGRVQTDFVFTIRHADIVGEPGSRLHSEWKTQHFFWSVPNTLPLGQAYMRTTLRHEQFETTARWPLVLYTMPAIGAKPQLTRIALWDYGLHRAGKAADPLGRFLIAAGINHMQATGDAYAAFAQQGIKSGGDVHHSAFAHREHPVVDVEGNNHVGDFASPQAVIDSRGRVIESGIEALASRARQEDGMGTIDFESSPLHGFSPSSIRAFKQRYHIRDVDFASLRHYMTMHQRKSHLMTQPDLKALYAKWVDFRTWQSAEYLRLMAQGLKAHNPAYRLEVTTHSSYSHAYRALSLGYNAAALAPYVDGILPQVYHGYGGAAAKLVMTVVGQWRRQVDTALYPILLVQFPGAKVRNSPRHLRQHILGALAEGANGVFLYYTQAMDGRYWRQLARISQEVALTEAFYQRGQRVRDVLVPERMPQRLANVALWPADQVTVENAHWHFTVHQQGGRYLLTLFNLRESNALTLRFSGKKRIRVLQARGLTSHQQGQKHLALTLPPQDVGFVVFDFLLKPGLHSHPKP